MPWLCCVWLYGLVYCRRSLARLFKKEKRRKMCSHILPFVVCRMAIITWRWHIHTCSVPLRTLRNYLLVAAHSFFAAFFLLKRYWSEAVVEVFRSVSHKCTCNSREQRKMYVLNGLIKIKKCQRSKFGFRWSLLRRWHFDKFVNTFCSGFCGLPCSITESFVCK